MLSRLSLHTARGSSRALSTFSDLNANRFDDHALKDNVPASAYDEFHASLDNGEALSKDSANAIAKGMMTWARMRGAANYAHWFSPMRGANGQKMDAFLDYDFGGEGQYSSTIKDMQVGFSGSQLFFNETDGSSFPNGGMRVTHRAAAFMNWDRKSAPFVRNGVLYIPASFVTHHGEALDEKTPLLRSEKAINTQGVRLLRALGDNESQNVVSNVGWEQEFFLIDREDFVRRPDLMAANRALIGAQPPRGQQTDFNYFNKSDPRARAFMYECSEELQRCGVPLTVMHNEVAPSQYEVSPIFKLTNVASDENTLCMEVMEDVAQKHGLAVLFHEKPFAGINGSGKHSNWGLNTDSGKNLYAPGKTAESQAEFMAFTAALTRAMNLHGDTLRVSVASAGNDHRLGAQEAPPAVMSLYTGDLLFKQIESIIAGGELAGYGLEQKTIDFGTNNVAPIQANLEDRNRTAPFPFCGNRWEFRAVGSTQNPAFPMAILNGIVADSCGELADAIEGGASPRDAVAAMYDEHKACIFNGNGYSEEWPVEAVERGLPNLVTTVDALMTFTSEKNKEVFGGQGIFTEREVYARQEVMLEKYTADLMIEATTVLEMMNTGVLPAAARDLQTFSGTPLGASRESVYTTVQSETDKLQELVDAFDEDAAPAVAARYCADVIKPALVAVREASDAAEKLIEDDFWPYPKYQDMLFSFHF